MLNKKAFSKRVFSKKVLVGFLAGTITTLIRDVPDLLMWKMGRMKYMKFDLASELINTAYINSFSGLLLGLLIDLLAGITLGILLVHIFNLSGLD